MRILVLATLLLPTLCCLAQFGPEQVLYQPAVNAPSAVVITDVDSDGSNDIVTASANDERISWFANDGTGQCGPQHIVTSHAPGVADLEAADMDGDGDADLLTATPGSNTIAWYRNDGLGNFATPQVIVDTAMSVQDVHVVDLDGDGDMDVLSAALDSELAWHANDGSGNFGAQQVIYGEASSAKAVTTADMDGDGDPDALVLASQDHTVHWFPNTGAGIFTDTLSIASMTLYAEAFSVNDMDGDGDLDVVALGGIEETMAWYTNDGSGGFGPELVISDNLGTAFPWKNRLLTGDVDGDADVDIVWGASRFSAIDVGYGLGVLRNSGSGSFTTYGSTPYVRDEYVGALCMGQLNDDPAPELVIGLEDNKVLSAFTTGAGVFQLLQTISGSSSHVMMVRSADLNGDGFADVLLGTTEDDDLGDVYADDYGTLFWQAGDGNGHFGEPQQIGGGSGRIRSLEVKDVEGDGDLDVFFAYEQTQAVYWAENLGTGTFQNHQIATSLLTLATAVGDLDGDGDQDFLLPNQSSNVLKWYAYNGGGVFASSGTQIANGTGSIYHLFVLDIDGDNDQDVVYGSSQLGWLANDGTGTFGPWSAFGTGIGITGSACFSDMDGDGDPDVILGTPTSIGWCANDGAGNFGAVQTMAAVSSTSVSASDLDNDGRMDVLYTSDNIDRIGWIRNANAGGSWEPQVISSTAVDAWDAFANDLDNDGDQDVLFASFSTSHSSWFENFVIATYSMHGSLFVDLDGNGVKDGADVDMGFGAVTCTPTPAFEYAGADGGFTLPADTGQYVIGLDLPPLWQLTTDSLAYHIHLTEQEPTSTGNDFGIQAAVDSSVVVTDFVSGQGPCGTVIPQWIHLTNAGTRQELGYVAVQFDPLYALILTVPPADSIVGNTVYWGMDTLDYFEYLAFRMHVLSPDASHNGEAVNTTVSVHLLDGTGSPTDTVATAWPQILSCAYDPNDKRVEPAGIGEFNLVHTPVDYLNYVIRFQNVGTDTAYTVVITDALSDHLDASTLQVTGFSVAPSEVRIEPDHTLVIRFVNILLPDSATDPLGSQGYFAFRIRPVAGLSAVTPITNTADIFFDLNAAVTTNSTLTTLVDCNAFTSTITQLGPELLQADQGGSYQWYRNGETIDGATGRELLATNTGFYTVRFMNQFGCTLLSEPTQVLITSMPDAGALRMALVPNPMNESARLIVSEALTADDRVELIDLSGRVVFGTNGNGSRELLLERHGLSSGIYLVRVVREAQPPAALRLVVK